MRDRLREVGESEQIALIHWDQLQRHAPQNADQWTVTILMAEDKSCSQQGNVSINAATFYWTPGKCQPWTTRFINTNVWNSHNSSTRLLLLPFYRWETWGQVAQNSFKFCNSDKNPHIVTTQNYCMSIRVLFFDTLHLLLTFQRRS